MAYGDFEDLPSRAASDKVLHDKEFNIIKNPKHDRNPRGLASLVHKNSLGGAVPHARSETLATHGKSAIMQNQQLAEELHKPNI